MADIIKNHPSYGIISLDRVHGFQKCFMARAQGSGYVVLTIDQAEYIGDSESRVLGTKRLVQVRFSNSQFLELISSLNDGPGTPCTISFLQGPVEEYVPEPSPYDIIENYVKEEINCINQDSSNITDYLSNLKEKGKASKRDILEMERLVTNLISKVNHNLPYIINICSEAIPKYIQVAKCELLAYVSRIFDKQH